MSATVLSRSYNESPHHHHFMVASGATERVAPALKPPATAVGVARSSSLKRDRPRFSGSRMRISFASDTRFIERPLRTRSSSRSAATAYNLRPVQGTDRPVKAKVRLPKATAATGLKYTMVSEEEYLNPRRAMDIAKSYGIPKYFLRGNTQVLTDGRMRLFGDNVWKKERTSIEPERPTNDSSDVINRLIDSVDKAIATSKKMPLVADDEGTLKLEIISLKSGADEKTSLRGSVHSLGGGANSSTEISTATEVNKEGAENLDESNAPDVHGAGEKHVNFSSAIWKDSENGESSLENSFHDLRPHTVDTTAGSLVRYLPKMILKDNELVGSGNFDPNRGYFPGTPQTSGWRSKQLASPFCGVSGSLVAHNRFNSVEDKYQNVLPRFFPAVSAHRHRQAEAEKAARAKKKSGHQRLVRFADTHTVRFSNDSSMQEPISGVVAQRAPVQSVQRSLDSHSGLSQAERSKRLKGLSAVAASDVHE